MTANSSNPTIVESSVGPPQLASLSPSRASDFKQCPYMYKLRSVDRIPTEPTIHQARGTTAHLALERLFQLSREERTPERLYDLFREAWTELRTTEYPGMFDDTDEERTWGLESLKLLADYFTVEDPTSFDPDGLEQDLSVEIGDMTIRGILDRRETIRETGPDGAERDVVVITDYKTGKAPPERYATKAFFALKIYALLLRVEEGITVDRLRLLYLNGPTEYQLDVNDAQLDAMEAQLNALWTAINSAFETQQWRTKRSVLCDWCDFKETLCPEFVDADTIAKNHEAAMERRRLLEAEQTGPAES